VSPADRDVVRVVALVSGHVQGVGYRWFVQSRAQAAGLSGSARNIPDGRVAGVLQGPADEVSGVLAALEGPDAPGRVSAVEHRNGTTGEMHGFTTA
jgi:acylphosphatase